ncbi:MAG: class I SAM-dependent methyltransferase [Lachnospiraceae bacterium]|nr:class I SAM-dependent methyltransferase [Lachnospiraceae bacterium]
MEEKKEFKKPVHLKQEELISKFPEKIGNVTLDYTCYPGEDLYSDGNVEEEILTIVKEASHVEYPSIIEEKNSWPVLYHLSPLRANIVDWLPIKKDHKVLEIGSGCGAITEKLSEKAGEVTCVDLSARRSHINAYRNQDKNNITIHVGNFSDIEPALPKDYDFICLIGVFEYAKSYIRSETPYEDFLKIMLKHVKNNGRVVIAIENKLGLKYFAGCKEDHVGEYFSGLEGYPEGGSARTFSRPGLERILDSCGVTQYSFYYPYPDYKFPTVIYSDRRLPNPGELTNNIRNFDRDRMLLFNEKYVFDGIINDGLFSAFSNSYMVVIGQEPEAAYVKYSNDRAEEYSLRTEIVDTPKGKVIRKSPLSLKAREHIGKMEYLYRLLQKRYEKSDLKINPCTLAAGGEYAEFPFEKGTTLEELLDRCLEKEDLKGFYKLFDKYLTLISYGEDSGITDYDLIFANILVNGDEWTVIDYEWTIEKVVSAKEIAFRAVYCYVLEEEKRNKLDLDLIMERLDITPAQADEYREAEWKFQKQVTGKRKSMGEIRAAIGTYCVDPKILMKEHLQRILDKRIQIYTDAGKGFSEENSYYMPDVYTNEYTIEAEIPFDGNVSALRIDPADRACVVKVEELLLNGMAVPLTKKTFAANGKNVKKSTWVFTTSDPNMTIRVSELPMQRENRLFIKMQLTYLPESIAADITEGVKKIFR